jgi:hypothetical protein
MNVNHTNTTVSATGGDNTSVNNSVEGTETDSVEAAPEDKAPNSDVKHHGMEKA